MNKECKEIVEKNQYTIESKVSAAETNLVAALVLSETYQIELELALKALEISELFSVHSSLSEVIYNLDEIKDAIYSLT